MGEAEFLVMLVGLWLLTKYLLPRLRGWLCSIALIITFAVTLLVFLGLLDAGPLAWSGP